MTPKLETDLDGTGNATEIEAAGAHLMHLAQRVQSDSHDLESVLHAQWGELSELVDRLALDSEDGSQIVDETDSALMAVATRFAWAVLALRRAQMDLEAMHATTAGAGG